MDPHDTSTGYGRERAEADAILHGIERDERRAHHSLVPRVSLLFTTWGVAWVLGYLAFCLAFFPVQQPVIPFAAAAIIGGVVLTAAIFLSSMHATRRAVGTRGPSKVQGAIYGNCYALAFTLMGLLGWRLTNAGVPLETMLSYWVAVPCLIVGILSLAGAAMWNDRTQLYFGVWTLVVGLASLVFAPPLNLLVGVAGGLGFIGLSILAVIRPAMLAGSLTEVRDG